jgi:serine/threonine-protein kinase
MGAALPIKSGGRIEVPLHKGRTVELELIDLLGCGGFGSVWKTVDAGGQYYALKVLQGVDPESSLAKRFRLEAEVAIPSPYTVQALGFREWDACTYLILFEYFDGIPLQKWYGQETFTIERRRSVLQQMLQGVAAAHQHNIIHRDLKPENLLMNAGGHLKVIDFGIAKFGESNLTNRTGFGTMAYLPPEILRSGTFKDADARTDIYALGHIYYELVMGQHFWERKGWGKMTGVANFASYLDNKRPQECIDLSDFKSCLYPQDKAVIARMVKRKAQARFDSVAAVLEELGVSWEDNTKSSGNGSPLEFPLLIVESGSNEGARTVLSLPAKVSSRILGRVELAGSDTSISRQHLEVSCSGGSYFIRDVGSKNGTWVNGKRLMPNKSAIALHHSDRIKVGDLFLRFAFLEEDRSGDVQG